MTARELLHRWEQVVRAEGRRQMEGGARHDPVTAAEYVIEAVRMAFGLGQDNRKITRRALKIAAIETQMRLDNQTTIRRRIGALKAHERKKRR